MRDVDAPEKLINVGIAMAFGCSISGHVNSAEVISLAESCLDAGADIIGIADGNADITKELSELCSKKGIGFVDAPVSGVQAGAESGQLTVMAGGDANCFNKVKQTIECYSKFIKLMGPSGSGQLTKMVNQICIAGVVQGLS